MLLFFLMGCSASDNENDEVYNVVKKNATAYAKEHGGDTVILKSPEITEIEFGNEPIVFEYIADESFKEEKGEKAYYVVFHDKKENLYGSFDLLYDKSGTVLYGIGSQE